MYIALCLALVHAAGDGVERFEDVEFRRGFVLSAASSMGGKVELGILRMSDDPDAGKPGWRLAQWGTRHLLEPGTVTPSESGVWEATTPGKRVRIERSPEGEPTVLLEGLAITEYAGEMRESGEPWPHLLIEQGFKDPIRMGDAARVPFTLEFRVPYCKAAPWAEGKLDPGRHTAQVSAYWTVHNRTADSPDHDEMIWFGIPLFDVRNEIPPPHSALDTAVPNGKFICSIDSRRFFEGNTGDGEWRTLEVDLVPLLREALRISQEHGYMKETRLEDLALTSFNLGWEIPGPYDAAFEVRGLSLKTVGR